MRLYPLFKKAVIENFRDWKILIMGVTFAPFFVVLMHFYFGEATETYRVAFVNHDQGMTAKDGNRFNAGQALISEIEKFSDSDGSVVLKVSREQEMTEAQKRLKNKSVDLVVEIPANFSQTLVDYKEGERPESAIIKTYGDPANPKYIMSAAWSDSLAFQFTADWTGLQGPLTFATESLSPSRSLTDFDLYVPGLLGLALMMLMFTAAASLAIIAISVLVAALLRTIFDLMTVGCFPFFILMFFSGGMFPIPTISLFVLGGRSINVNDILPTTHSITAFGKILNQGAGLCDVVFEMGAIAVLTVLYFAIGIWLFTKRHMRAV